LSTLDGRQRIIPYLAYSDAPAALSFLCDAFGFEERYRMAMDDGRIGHAELAYKENVIMLASVWKEAGFASPMDLSGIHTQVYCRVDDADAHYERARAAGATIIAEPVDQPYGERMYRALDPEGHRWLFASPLAGKSEEPKEPA
jgi:uncharacterized glyoxalase superfamily protein PhnB